MKTINEPAEPRDETEAAAKEELRAVANGAAKAVKTPMSAQLDDLAATVRRLEAFATEEAKRVSAKLLPEVESRARQNIWVSLLFALGLGLILGLWLNGNRRSE